MTIIKLNDLYFPHGNEHGENFETYYKVIDRWGNIAYGQTAAIAILKLKG